MISSSYTRTIRIPRLAGKRLHLALPNGEVQERELRIIMFCFRYVELELRFLPTLLPNLSYRRFYLNFFHTNKQTLFLGLHS